MALRAVDGTVLIAPDMRALGLLLLADACYLATLARLTRRLSEPE